MERKSHNVTVGAFVLAGILALIGVVIWLGGTHFAETFAYYQTSFTGPVAGLGKGTVVRYNGIDVGHVSELDFDPSDPKGVIGTFQVPPDLRLHVDSMASVESEGVTGGTYVEITGGATDTPIVMTESGRKYPFIPSKPSSIQKVKDITPELLARLDRAADRASDLLNDDNRKAVAATLANLTLASERLSVALKSTDEAAKHMTQLSNNVDGVVNGSKKQIEESAAQLSRLLSESRVLVGSLTRLTNDIQRQPTELLFGDQRKGYTPK
jgi:phospholipid/cholesterol/gamma-HCH transport system substrate-binding protein